MAPRRLARDPRRASAREFYGPPHVLLDVEEAARNHGLPTRRTGPTVSILRAEAAPDELYQQVGDGIARAANLEDVFVLLTGERLES